MPPFLDQVGRAITDAIQRWREHTERVNQITSTLIEVSSEAGDRGLAKAVLEAAAPTTPGGALAAILRGIMTIGQVNFVIYDAALTRFKQFLAAAYRTALPTVDDIIDWRRRKLIDDNTFRRYLLRHGHEDQAITNYSLLVRRFPEAGTIIDAYFRGVIDEGTLHTTLERMGYGEDDRRVLIESARLLISPLQLIDGWRRGIIADVDAELRKYGFRDTEIESLKAITEFVPSPTELARMGLKDVFEPEIIRTFQLDAEFDDAWRHMEPWAKKAGVSREVMRFFWMAQWDLPSPTQAFEMFQRGIITRQELEVLFKQLDILPYWRERLLKLAYNPLTRVDVRRMFRMGVLTKEEVVRAYMDLGYNEENARRLADFVEVEARNSEETKQGRARNLSQAMILTLYKEGIITREKARELLIALRFDEDEAELLLDHQDLQGQIEVVRETRQAVETAYTAAEITADEARARLVEAGYRTDVIDGLLAAWDIRREIVIRRRLERENRDLTKTEILDAFIDRMIDRSTAATMLKQLGYDDREVSILIERAILQQKKREKAARLSALRSLYIARRMPDADILRELDALGLPALERAGTVAKWEEERREHEAKKTAADQRLTVKELFTLLAIKAISETELRDRLKQEGYSDKEIGYLTRLYGQSS
jgi:hypothetical protein